MKSKKYAIGVDFGSLSGRALAVNVENGEELATSTLEYRHAVMDEYLPGGARLPRAAALQDPDDYIEVIGYVIRDVMKKAGITSDEVVGVGIDFTSCTLLPVDENGEPLCWREKYKNEPQAYVKLWKDHSSQEEAREFERVAIERGEAWLQGYGGHVSSEWLFPKVLECARRAPDVYRDTFRFIEAGDWMVWQLTGRESHSACFASAKAFWSRKDGYPSDEYFRAVDERLAGIIGTKVCADVLDVTLCAGHINAHGASLTGLAEGTVVSTAMTDGHPVLAAVGATHVGDMMMIAGTSGVQMANTDSNVCFPGACGLFYGCTIPGLYTYESGQSGFGDMFDWFVNNCVPYSDKCAADAEGVSIHQYLRERAARLAPGESGLIALDWWNGNRCVLVNADLTGVIVGMTLVTRSYEIYRALLEALAFSTRVILEGYSSVGISPKEICIAGGIAQKDDLLMQIFADVLGIKINVAASKQTPALGSVIYASVAAGCFANLDEASAALVHPPKKSFTPIPEHKAVYDKLYEEYMRLHDYFGRGGNDVMMRLHKLSDEAKKNKCTE